MNFIREISYNKPKKRFATIIELKNKNDQNRLKFFIKRNKYTLIPLRLINLYVRV